MGGRSRSTQKTEHKQTTTNHVNDGEFAGASDIVVTEDSNNTTVEDSYNTETNNEIDNSVEDSFNTENNIDQEFDNSIEDSYNTDISDSNNVDNRVDGDVYHGNVEFSDSGAIDAAKDIAEKALEENTSVSKAALSSNERVADKAFDFGSTAVREVSSVASDAIDGIKEFGVDSLSEFADELGEASGEFYKSIESVSKHQLTQNQNTTAGLINAQRENLKVLSEVARNTSLQGQDLVASSSERMVKYVIGGLTIVALIAGVAMTVNGRGKE